MNVLDDYMIDPRLSLLDKTRIQAQVAGADATGAARGTRSGKGRRDCEASLARLVEGVVRCRG